MNAKLHKQQGFTLVEIAIVLVIIGLLLGAVFKGQELIGQAKVKNAQKQFDEIRAAYYTYLDKKNTVAGDDGTNGGTANDGIVDSNNSFWNNLQTENLVNGTGGTAPNNPYGIALIVAGNTANYLCSKMPEKAAEQIDIKADDGNATTGSFIWTGTTQPALGTDPTTQTAAYANPATDTLGWLCTKF
ncbi:type II secretion system protein [Sulfurivirga sp.]|uniref:type II secretion system protein n=1 Tax=Sulfurivirga sp. TaxID=2614236 RepID=UPI0025DA7274|nr:type II secretion system protein [Sulfurivirga sp.]